MLIIYGLGNNEEKYLKTKHNIGRRVVEEVAQKDASPYSKNKSYYYTKSKQFHFEEVFYIYSSGYMNESGRPLVEFCKYHPVDADAQLLIVHDDSDQIEGNVKLLPKGGSAGHHGINSIYRELLATPISIEHVWRLKIGIRPPENKLRSETFVLSRLSKQDDQTITYLSSVVFSQLPNMVDNEWERVQNSINS
jgi:PTH1 family peptidyl-tRNA hydrolase